MKFDKYEPLTPENIDLTLLKSSKKFFDFIKGRSDEDLQKVDTETLRYALNHAIKVNHKKQGIIREILEKRK